MKNLLLVLLCSLNITSSYSQTLGESYLDALKKQEFNSLSKYIFPEDQFLSRKKAAGVNSEKAKKEFEIFKNMLEYEFNGIRLEGNLLDLNWKDAILISEEETQSQNNFRFIVSLRAKNKKYSFDINFIKLKDKYYLSPPIMRLGKLKEIE